MLFEEGLDRIELDEARSHAAANLPRRGFDLETPGDRLLLCLSDPITALAGCLDRDVERCKQPPGRISRLSIKVVLRSGAQLRVRPLCGCDDASLGNAPLRSRDIEVRMVVESGQRQEIEIPRRGRPRRNLLLKIVLQEVL